MKSDGIKISGTKEIAARCQLHFLLLVSILRKLSSSKQMWKQTIMFIVSHYKIILSNKRSQDKEEHIDSDLYIRSSVKEPPR